MADKFQLKALLVAVDKVTRPLAGINGAIKRTQHTLKALGKEGSNLVGSIGLPVSAAFAAAGFGMFHAARMALEYAGSLQDASEMTGISVEHMQGLFGVFAKAGVGAEEAASALAKLNKGMAEAAAGKDESFANLFKKMGISLRNSKGEIIGIEEALPKIAASFEATTNPAIRARMAVELFGKAGQRLIPTLMKGGKSLGEAVKEMGRLGAIVSAKGIEALDDLGDELGVLKQQGKAQLTELFGSVAPSLTPAVKALQEWIAQNKDMLRLKAGAWLKNLADQFKAWIESGGIEKLASQISSVWGAFAGFVEFIGGFKNLMIGIGIAFAAGPIASIMNIIALLPKLGIAFVTLGRAMLAVVVKNPILLAAAAIGAAVYLIYKNWDGIVSYFKGIFDDIMRYVQPILDAAKAVASFLGLGNGAQPEGIAGLGNGADNAFDPNGSPIGQRPIIGQQNANVQGQLKVSFENAPPGMRVDNGQTNQPGFNINPDVGYRTEYAF